MKKIILKFLEQTRAITFETWKSPTHLEQYTSIKFFGKEIQRIKWSDLESLFKL